MIILGGVFILKAMSPLYPYVLMILTGYGHLMKTYKWSHHYYYIIRQSYVLIPIILCFFAKIKSNNFEKNSENKKFGVDGFFTVALIRNIFLPLSMLATVIALVQKNISISNTLFLQEVYYTNSMIIVLMLGVVLSIIALVNMFRKKSAFMPIIIVTEYTLICYYTNKIVTSFIFAKNILMSTGYFDSGINTDIAMVMTSLLFIIYYAKSKRAANTFVK